MPTSTVHDHGHVLVRCNRFGKLLEIDLHHLRRQFRQHQCESVVSAGLGGSEDVGKCEAVISKPEWTLALGKPDVTDAAFLPDPRFVLKEQADALVLVCICNFLQRFWGSF